MSFKSSRVIFGGAGLAYFPHRWPTQSPGRALTLLVIGRRGIDLYRADIQTSARCIAALSTSVLVHGILSDGVRACKEVLLISPVFRS